MSSKALTMFFLWSDQALQACSSSTIDKTPPQMLTTIDDNSLPTFSNPLSCKQLRVQYIRLRIQGMLSSGGFLLYLPLLLCQD